MSFTEACPEGIYVGTRRPCLTRNLTSTFRNGGLLKRLEHVEMCLGGILSGDHVSRCWLGASDPFMLNPQ